MKKFYVYLITNTILKKSYIGSRMAFDGEPIKDHYMGSSKYLKEDYKLYGIENFSKEIIKEDYENKEEMLDGETEFIIKYNTLEPKGYNRSLPNVRKSFHTGGTQLSSKTKQKIGNGNRGKVRSEEFKRNVSSTNKNKTYYKTKEFKDKISHIIKGKPSKLKNIPRSEKTKQKISESKKLNPFIYTEEIRLKMSLAKKGKTPWNKGKKFIH